MLGNPGSNPLELFWDVVDALDQRLDKKIAIVEEALARHGAAKEEEGSTQDKSKPKGYAVGPDTTEEEFNSIFMTYGGDSVATLTAEDLHEVYKTVRFCGYSRC